LNTHDMAPFKGYVEAHDLNLYDELKVLEREKVQELREDRKATMASWFGDWKLAVDKVQNGFEMAAESIAKSPAELILINIEDLWQETEPQNIPGTWKEYPNWRRRLRYSLEEWTANPVYQRFLKNLSDLRLKNNRGKDLNSERTDQRKDGGNTKVSATSREDATYSR
jgi:4-alpha-glucanotransferase